MKIIHFVPYYPPEGLGGVGEFAAALHEALLADGHDSLVVTAGRASTATVRRIAPRPLAWFLKTACWARRAAQYDIVHCQGGEAAPLLLALAFLPRKARILTTFHVTYAGIGKAFRPYRLEGRRFAQDGRALVYRTVVAWGHRLIDWLTLRLSDEVNAISEALAGEMLRGAKARDVPVIYCGLSPLPSPGPDPGIAPVALFYAGAASHRKRVNALPFVLEHVRATVPEAKLRIAGFDLEAQPELKALFEERGLLPFVECVGVKESCALPAYYRAAQVVVVQSAYEGLPLVILEAMRCGTPVVATRVSGHAEAIEDGENGFLAPADDPRAMADRCVEILDDPALSQRLGRAAQQTFEARFRLEREVDAYLNLYRRLLGEKT